MKRVGSQQFFAHEVYVLLLYVAFEHLPSDFCSPRFQTISWFRSLEVLKLRFQTNSLCKFYPTPNGLQGQ